MVVGEEVFYLGVFRTCFTNACGVTMGIVANAFNANKCLSPLTIKSASAASAQARNMSSVGSSMITGEVF